MQTTELESLENGPRTATECKHQWSLPSPWVCNKQGRGQVLAILQDVRFISRAHVDQLIVV